MSFVLTAIGTLMLLPSLSGILFGAFMAAHPRTRKSGGLFAGWWVSGVATALGVLMRDPVTFVVGLVCFAAAGAAFALADRGAGSRPRVRRKRSTPRAGTKRSPGTRPSQRTTRENRTRRRRAAS